MEHRSTPKPCFLALAAVAVLGMSTASTLALAEPAVGESAGRAAEKAVDYVSDSSLTAQVKTALIAETKLESMKIDVESSQGVVTLSGEVPNRASIALASNVASRVNGVKQVHNKLETPRSS